MKIGINHIAEFVSVIVAIYCYPLLKGSYMKWFLPFLVFILLGELVEAYQSHYYHVSTIPVNYLIGTVESVFYGYIFYHLNTDRIRQKQLCVMILLSIAGYIISYVVYGSATDPFVYNLVISGFMLSLIALLYLYDSFDNDHIHMLSDPGFWLAFGICLFYSSISIVFMSWRVILLNNISVFGLMLYHLVPKLLCVLLYGSISLALISYARKKLRAVSVIA